MLKPDPIGVPTALRINLKFPDQGARELRPVAHEEGGAR